MNKLCSKQHCLHNDLYCKCGAGIHRKHVTQNIHLCKVTLTALIFKVHQTPAAHILNVLRLATVAIYPVVKF